MLSLAARRPGRRSSPSSSPSSLLWTTLSCTRRCRASKADVKLLAVLRQESQASISVVREALLATDNGYDEARRYLDDLLAKSGSEKAGRLAGRTTAHGRLALAQMPRRDFDDGLGGQGRSAMVELKCESDFVARNDLFRRLADDVANTAMLLHEPVVGGDDGGGGGEREGYIHCLDLAMLLQAPVMAKDPLNADPSGVRSIEKAIEDGIAKLGEKIKLEKAWATAFPDAIGGDGSSSPSNLFTNGFVHNDRIGALVVLQVNGLAARLDPSLAEDVGKVARAIARQVTAFETRSIGSPTNLVINTVDDSSGVLLEQPAFAMASLGVDPSASVGQALQDWAKARRLALKVLQIQRRELGS